MKIMYVASSPRDRGSLNLGREIHELQRRFDWTSVDPISISFLPDLRVEDLPGELSKARPDVLHLAAHGDKQSLSLSDEDRNEIQITAEMLRGFFPPNHAPRLVYLNSCDSMSIARKLVDSGAVPMAIGSTAPISNRVARTSAVAFYERLLAGLTIEQSFGACKQMAEAMAGSRASVKLFLSEEASPNTEVLHPLPRLVADFMDGKVRPASDNHFSFRLGLTGCPAGTSQVVFFTDDGSFIQDEDRLERDLSWIIRSAPVNGTIWTDEETAWRAEGDHRLLAVGVKPGVGTFVVDSTLCEAIENRYRLSALREIPKIVANALRVLRANNGAELNPTVWDSRRKTKQQKAGKRS